MERKKLFVYGAQSWKRQESRSVSEDLKRLLTRSASETARLRVRGYYPGPSVIASRCHTMIYRSRNVMRPLVRS